MQLRLVVLVALGFTLVQGATESIAISVDGETVEFSASEADDVPFAAALFCEKHNLVRAADNCPRALATAMLEKIGITCSGPEVRCIRPNSPPCCEPVFELKLTGPLPFLLPSPLRST